MTPTPAVRRILLLIGMLLMLALAWTGLSGGLNQIGLLAGGATLLIALAIVWLLRVGARGLS